MNIEYPNWNGFASGLCGLDPSDSAPAKLPKIAATGRMGAKPPPGSWRYPVEKRRGLLMGLALVISASSHAAFFFCFNGHKAAKPVAAGTEVVEINFAPPPVPEDVLDEEVVDMTGERGEALAGVDVPSLPDLPTTVNLSDFTQAFDMASLLPKANVEGAKNLSVIPGNFRRGGSGGTATSIGNIFNLSDLDRAPAATFQPAPSVPAHMLREASSAHVTVEFIVSVKGEVLDPHVVKSDNEAFNELAVRAIKKWKFRPGYRRGKTVNVRMQQPMRFTVGGD
jgi:TonB family protein